MKSADLPPQEQKTQFVRSMFDGIAHRYDLVNRLMTLGLDRGWRKRTITAMKLEPEALILDLGCGTGDLIREAANSGYQCIGIDLSYEMLSVAHKASPRLVEADAAALPIAAGSVAGVVSGFALRNFTDQRSVFHEIARVLVPGGRLAILEVDRPRHMIVRMGHGLWFNYVVPKIGAIFSDASAYRYLPKSVTYLPSPDALATLLGESGFCWVERTQLQGGLAQIVTATKSEESS